MIYLYTSISFRMRVHLKKYDKKLPNSFYDTRDPINMATIRKNLESGKYKQQPDVAADFHLIFKTGILNNDHRSTIFKWYSKCYQVFKRFMENIDRENHLPGFCYGYKFKTLSCNEKQHSILSQEKLFASCKQNEVKVNKGPAQLPTYFFKFVFKIQVLYESS